MFTYCKASKEELVVGPTTLLSYESPTKVANQESKSNTSVKQKQIKSSSPCLSK